MSEQLDFFPDQNLKIQVGQKFDLSTNLKEMGYEVTEEGSIIEIKSGGSEEKSIKFKFNEPAVLEELKKYIESTYSQHYAKKKIQTLDLILSDENRAIGYLVGNMIKYPDRFGKKDGFNRKDILKAIHYGIILLGITLVNDKD